MTECSCPSFTLQGPETTLYFPMPEWGSPDNRITKSVDLFNFWKGDIDTADRGINDQPLNIGGVVRVCGPWVSATYPLCFPICFPACFNEVIGGNAAMTDWLISINNAMNNGEEFTISELGDCLNGIYVIKDFTFDTIEKSPDAYAWSLKLERVRDII